MKCSHCGQKKEAHENRQTIHVHAENGQVKTYFSAVCKAFGEGKVRSEIKNPAARGRQIA